MRDVCVGSCHVKQRNKLHDKPVREKLFQIHVHKITFLCDDLRPPIEGHSQILVGLSELEGTRAY